MSDKKSLITKTVRWRLYERTEKNSSFRYREVFIMVYLKTQVRG